MPTFQTSPGMRDILPPESARWRAFVAVFEEVVGAAGYGQIIPPYLEDLGVFHRVGEATDIVTKEMYDFVDKGGRHVALRPEFTASICRAFVEHSPQVPWKVWAAGSNFRYEKPQRGRYRQFDQVDIEVLGATDPYIDVEVIALGWEFFRRLGLQQVTLVLNSLGEPDDRARYVAALAEHFGAQRDALSKESVETLERNPLRVLDSKREQDASGRGRGTPDRRLLQRHRRRALRDGAARAHRPRHPVHAAAEAGPRPRLLPTHHVRVPGRHARLGAERRGRRRTVRRAGRGAGGSATPGIGLALGVDRTLIACDAEGVFAAPAVDLDVFVVDTTGGEQGLLLTSELRAAGLRADRAFENRSMKSQMKAADRSNAAVALIVGTNELAEDTVVLRPLRTGEHQQTSVGRADLIDAVKKAVNR